MRLWAQRPMLAVECMLRSSDPHSLRAYPLLVITLFSPVLILVALALPRVVARCAAPRRPGGLLQAGFALLFDRGLGP